MAQRREARAADHFGLGHQRLDHRFERGRTQDHRLLAAAQVEQPVGEYMPALAIGGDLRLVERDEGQVAVHRHRFGGAQQPARVLGLDPFLAGDQRNAVLALDRADPVIDLARQQPQRKADRAARMRAEPFDGEVGLAGVGRPEHRLDPAVLRSGLQSGAGALRLCGREFGHCEDQCGIGLAPRQGTRATVRLAHAAESTGFEIGPAKARI